MNYEESLKFIHSLERFGSKPGLERVAAMLESLGNPQDDLKFLHVAGTNGKGSTSVFLSGILRAAGLKTGLYISPFVVDFRERIQIGGEFIQKETFAAACTRAKEVYDSLPDDTKPTEFEFITAAAFCCFKNAGCDIVVLETGLGGRLDATNIIKNPIGSVITKIGLDHTEVLGDTIEKIAAEKCGIIKAGCPVFTSSSQEAGALEVIKTAAREKEAELYVSNLGDACDIAPKIAGTSFILGGTEYTLNMPGIYQVENALLSIKVVNTLFPEIGTDIIKKALSAAAFPARFEILSRKPLIILDGAHNPEGITVLKNSLDALFIKDFTAVIGMMADKNIESSLKIIAPLIKNAVCVTVESNKRSELAENLKTKVTKYCGSAETAPNLLTALKIATEKASGPIVIFGSLYLAGEVKALIKQNTTLF